MRSAVKLLRVIRSTDPESGGPIEALLRTSEALIGAGHHVEIASLESEREAAQRRLPFPVHALGCGAGRYGFNPRLVSWLAQNAAGFDAVTLHGLWNYTSIGSWRALRKLDVPFCIYAHGMMDPWFRERYPAKHVLKQMLWTLAEGRVLRDARAVLFTSEEERARARSAFYGYSYHERVVCYGTADPGGNAQIQKSAFLSAFPELAGRRFLLFLSRVHPKKGCDLLLHAFAEALPFLPRGLDLVIAGPDQVGWVRQLKALAGGLGIGARVHWPGMLYGDVKWGAFRSSDALILPSHQENFGIVAAEAMACAIPVLISNKVNIWREVQMSGAGLVEPDTKSGTLELIRRFCALSESGRADMQAAARRAFLQRFHIDAATRDLAHAIGFDGA